MALKETKKISVLECITRGITPTLNVTQMATLLGVSKTTIRAILAGQTPYTPPPAYKIGKAWRCNLKDFATWVETCPIQHKIQKTRK